MANASLQLDQDLEVVERRTDVKIVLSVPARFLLASRRDTEGQRREFPCRVINVSCYSITLATPVTGEINERVIVWVDEFGKLEGPIIRQLDGGFTMEIIASKPERYKLAAKIEWYEKKKNHDVTDKRRHPRFLPKQPNTTLVLADGTTTDCLVQNFSVSGVAVTADVVPKVGIPIAVGKVLGVVVRHFPEGFAVQFVEAQDPETVESLLIRAR